LSLFNELKRRNVFKVAIAYIVVAWLVAQVLQLIFESFGTPDWVMKTVLVLMAAGLLFALFFAWAFEMTPEGLKKESEIDHTQSISPHTGKKLNNLIFVVMALAIGYFAYDKFVLSAGRETTAVETALQEATQDASTETDKSIAVLPFVNMSSDEEQEYFSDGLSEELLNLLAKIPELQVAALTSSFSLKGKELQISEVGEILKVAHVLEGSVRKAGNQVRITAQLIHAEDGYHLWSETYDRSLDDIFAIQDEIAREVVAQLKLTLLGAVPTVQETDPEAFALYLQARHLGRLYSAESSQQSTTLLKQVLAINPDYSAAWALLGLNYLNLIGSGKLENEEGLELATEVLNKALAIDPDNASALSRLAAVERRSGNFSRAAKLYERALFLEPSNPIVLANAAVFLHTLGRPDEALALEKILTSRDPVSPRSHSNLGLYYQSAGQWDKAIASYRTVLVLSPAYAGGQYDIGVALMLKGEPQAALEAMQLETSGWGLIGLPMAYHALGRKEESDAALAELIAEQEQSSAYNIAYVLAYRGEADRAFEWLAKAVDYQDGGLAVINNEALFTRIHDDPRWLPFLESIGRSPEQLAAIKFEVKLPK
jgi:TolB-like protein/Flp pilus assembly protein TadD